MPTEPRRISRKVVMLQHRSARSAPLDTSSASETLTSRSPTSRRQFWRRRRSVTPAKLVSVIALEQQPDDITPPQAVNDPNDTIVFLNNPTTEFDLRSYFFKKQKSVRTIDRLERSAINQSSVTSYRGSHTNEFSSINNSYRGGLPFGTKLEATNQNPNALFTQTTKARRRLRAREELCIVLPRSDSRGRMNLQKSWFLGPGYIGRDPGEGTLVVTKDKSMDAVHAEVSVSGDDYFVRDTQSTTGTFLCLSTQIRHYPQRDGFRLRSGDVFHIGPATSIRVLDLQTITVDPNQEKNKFNLSSTSICRPETFMPKCERIIAQPPTLESIPNTSGETPQSTVKRTATAVEFLAPDIDDKLTYGAGRRHPMSTSRNGDSVDSQPIAPEQSKPHHTVHFADTPPVMLDGSIFLGSRYIRPATIHYSEPPQVEDEDDDMIKQLIGSENDTSSNTKIRRSASVRLQIFQYDSNKASIEPLNSREAREVTLIGQNIYLIGSSSACDVRILPSEGVEVREIHARIMFDGVSFVLQDLSFERDPRRQTRVLLTQRPVRVTRGDWLLLGTCTLYITTVARAMGSERRPDMKEAAMRLDVLRLSKRKPRTRGMFVPVGFRLLSSSGSGASSGSSGWGGSSGGPVTFGKGRDCDVQVFTASLATEQFSVQLERGTCMITPKPTGINAGTYFLIGRDEAGPPYPDTEAETNEDDTMVENSADIVKHTSKPLLLSEGCVFRCGGCEVGVIYLKSTISTEVKSTIEEQEHVQFLSKIPWLKPIASDSKTIANVARCGQRMTLSPGAVVYEKGDGANFVFIVLSGEVALEVTVDNVEPSKDNGRPVLVEQVAAGGFFGEMSLYDPVDRYASSPNTDDLEYLETAKAATACELLVLARKDICGYLELYMDIIRAQLRHDRCRDRIIRVACSRVPWLKGISPQEMRTLSAQAEVVAYPHGSTLFEDGKLFVPAAFGGGSTLQLRDGLLILNRGNARVLRSKHEKQYRWRRKIYHAEDVEERDLETVHDIYEAKNEPDEWWSSMEPVIAMSSSSSPSVLSFCDLSFRLDACSTVECYFIAAIHFADLSVGISTKEQNNPSSSPEIFTAAHILPPLKRRNSNVARRMHHSKVVTSALRDSDSNGADDDDHSLMDGSDGEGDTTAAHRWRRKKRNKDLLEQTVLQTKNDAQIPNAMVLYLLAGAQRGDIHVVRNVASIGGLLSGADIELNDRYVSPKHAVIEYHDSRYWLYDNGSKWGTFVRLEEENAVDINPGDVFLAGEVEFTCLASYPERNKPSMCCIM